MQRQVAHALLTRPPLSYLQASSPITPFDLNVLCTPPAFILSQDQTLELIVLKSLLQEVFQSVRAFFLSFFYFCLSSILFQNFTRSFFRTILFSLCTSSISCCSIFNDQFRCPSKYTALLLYHKHLSFVKYFFPLF